MNPATPLGRYRLLAYVVGVGLVLLVCVAVPLKYAAGSPGMAKYLGMAHGFLYMVYLVSTLDLALRRRLKWIEALLVAAAGTVPFMSFVAERWVTRTVNNRAATESAAGEVAAAVV